MKHIYALLLILLSTYGFSQTLSELKYDSIVKIEYTDLSLVYLKKKTAVWHDANFFVAKPTKNYFIYLESAELLVEVDFKHKDFYAIVQDENTGGYKRFFLANEGFEAEILHSEFDDNFLLLDSTKYSLSLNKIENTGYGHKIGQIGLKLDKTFLKVTDYKNSVEDVFNQFPILSLEYPDEDSVSFEGNVVYSPLFIFPGVSNSGIYNFKEKKWPIKPNYSQLISFQNRILLSTELDTNKISLDSVAYYSLLQIDKYKSLIINNNITTNNLDVVQLMTDYDSVQQLNDKIHYITYKNGKQGLIEYQLFHSFFDNYKQKVSTLGLDFHYSETLPPENDFVYYSPSQDISIVKNDSFYTTTKFYGNDIDTIYNSIKYFEIDKSDEYPYYKFEFNQMNDSLILIIDIVDEQDNDYPLTDENGELLEKMDENGEWDYVYPPTEPGQYHCGLYNLNQNKWIIEPNEYDIQYFGGNSVIIEKPEFDEHHIIQSLEHKSIYDLNGEFVISDLSTKDLITKQENLEKILLLKNETLESYNISYYSNINIPDTLNNGPYYYKIKSQNKEKIISLDRSNKSVNIDNISDYHHLVIHDPQTKFDFYINDNNTVISFSIMEDSIEMKNIEGENYKLEIYTVLDYEYIISSLVILTTDKDTTLYEFGLKSEVENLNLIEDYKSRTNRVITIIKGDDEIIYDVSNAKGSFNNYYDYYDYYEFGDGDNALTIEWEQEFSCIYQKSDNKWIKVSPNYSNIQKLNFGYLCKTGKYQTLKNENWDNEDLTTIASSYILLDSTLKPIGYSDFYNFDLIEDLGFGLKICPVNDKEKWNTTEGHGNCFFVDYNGKALCDAKYDRFELVDGKIYGIRDKVYKWDDEFDMVALDDDGDYIIIQTSARDLIGEVEN